MSSVAEAIIDVCARTEAQYGFKVVRLAVDQGAFNKLRAETDWCSHLTVRKDGAVLFNDVEVVVDA